MSDQPCGVFFQALYTVSRTVNSSLDTLDILKTIVASAADALGAKACSLRLLAPDAKQLLFGAAHGLSASYRAKGPVHIEHSPVDRQALSSRAPVYIGNTQTDPRFQYGDHARAEGIVSVLVVPMCVQDQPIGVLRIYDSQERVFDSSELALAEAIASLSALAIENGRLYERLHRDYRAAIDFGDRLFD